MRRGIRHGRIAGLALLLVGPGGAVAGCAESFDLSLGNSVLGAGVSASEERICRGDCLELVARPEGGYPPYSVTWSGDLPGGPGPHRVCPGETTEYTVTIEDAEPNATPPVTASRTVIVDDCTGTTDGGRWGDCDPEQCLCVPNPSFEGQPAYGRAPDPYVRCESAPDTRDGNGHRPTDGNTYLGMQSGPGADTASVALCRELRAGVDYELTIDLAVETARDRDRPAPVRFELWGGDSACDRAELLWAEALSEFDADWSTHSATLTPSTDHAYVTLRSSGAETGYVVIDNLVDCPCETRRWSREQRSSRNGDQTSLQADFDAARR